jgi:hypothetical protein
MSTEKNFAKGFIFKRNANAPGFVVGNISVKVDEAIAWLQANQSNGWVNMKVNTAKSGSYYMELDTWATDGQKIKEAGQLKPAPEVDDSLPF